MLPKVTLQILNELQQVLEQISATWYAQPISILHESSIGKHTRHILDFYICLINAVEHCEICYDNRTRDEHVEQNPEVAVQSINYIKEKIQFFDLQQKIILKQHFLNKEIQLKTTIKRELLYNLEHTIHHNAIIRIGIENSFPNITIPKDFGIAYSTLALVN